MSSCFNNRGAIKISLNSLGAFALLCLFQLQANAQVNIKQINSPSQVTPVKQEPQVSQPEIRLVLRLTKRRVYVYKGEKVLASYPVAIGKPGWETPLGNFKVIEMLENPGWTNFKTGEVIAPGKNSPLGERWIAFWTDGRDYIGFHGTPNRASVGKAVSHGCVRMYNEDVRKLYNFVKLRTSVTVSI